MSRIFDKEFLDLPVQDYFIYERIYLLDKPLKTSALLKQVPLLLTVHSLTIIRTCMMYGNMCPLTGTLSISHGRVCAQ
jgi:hypothetical protein